MKDTTIKTSFFPNHKILFCQENIYLDAQAIVAQELFDLPKAFVNSVNDNLGPVQKTLFKNSKVWLGFFGIAATLSLIWLFS